MKQQLSIYALLLCLLAPIAFGSSIQSYDIAFDMQDDAVITQVAVVFNQSIEHLGFTLPPGSKLISATLDNETVSEHQLPSIDFTAKQSFTATYTSDYYLDHGDFLFDFKAPLDIPAI